MLRAVLPITHEEAHVPFSAEGLARLKHGLEEAGLDPKYFAWPPTHDQNRPPYRGLRPLEAEDAGIFFGRDAPIVEALDRLRGLRETTPPRLLVILGASGAGKSSFLRAGLFPRLARDDRNFLPLPAIRPERAAINGETGLLVRWKKRYAPGSRRRAPSCERPSKVVCQRSSRYCKRSPTRRRRRRRIPTSSQHPPTLIISIDQGEELFQAEGQDEAQALLTFSATCFSTTRRAHRRVRHPLRRLRALTGAKHSTAFANFRSILGPCRKGPTPR